MPQKTFYWFLCQKMMRKNIRLRPIGRKLTNHQKNKRLQCKRRACVKNQKVASIQNTILSYDGTVRNGLSEIVQFNYGGNNTD